MKLTAFLGANYRRWYFALLIACLLTGISYAIYRIPLFQVLERKVEDLHFILNETVPDSSIVMIAIDDNSLEFTRENHLPWPWPRDIWYPILSFMNVAEARNILFDLQFTDPDFDRAETFADETDGMFAEAIRMKSDVILGVQLVPESTMVSRDIGTFCLEKPDTHIENRYQGMLEPIEVLRKAASNLGVINVEPDDDGIIRRIPLYYSIHDIILPQLALTPVCDRDNDIHTDKEGKFRLYWYGGGGVDGAFGKQYISMCYVLALARQHLYGDGSPEADALLQRLRGKYVIIGTTAGGLFDLKPTPTDRIFPGMEIWATALSNYLQGDNIYNLPLWLHLSILVLIAFGVYFSFARFEQSVIVPLLASVAGIILLSGICWHFWNLLLPVISILNTFLIAYIVTATTHYLLEGRAKRQIRSVFSRYLSADVVHELIRDPDKVEMGGKEVDATVFFSDIADFTHISESRTPKELVRYLNEYFNNFVDILLSRGGLLDKYTGDGLMALFGVPIPRHDHAVSACLAALEHKRLSRTLIENPGADFTRHFHLNTRIGINSGKIVSGNIGSVKRMDYTAIGDDVNLAARLEGVNKIYHTSIMISESTFKLVEHAIQCRELDTIRVKGKDKPTKIYEVIAPIDEPYDKKLVDLYATALELYRDGAWSEAAKIFQKLSETPFYDGASGEMHQRCIRYRKQPPREWDGVHTLEVK